jgi:hypothetical protein
MSIIRTPRKAINFTILSNYVIQDNRLSMKALGMLVRLLSRPDNWSTNSETLAREFDCGREQIRTVLGELAEYGYMKLNKTQNDKGQWSSSWSVFDEPEYSQPEPGNPYFGSLGPITSTVIQRTNTKAEEPVGFTSFWRVYPNKKAKPAALKAFNKAKVTDIDLILNHIDVMTRSEQWQNVQYIPFPATYLNQRRWEDDTIAPTNQFAGFK